MSIERILIVISECKETGGALEVGAAMAQEFGAAVRLVHVIDPRLACPPEAGAPRELLLADLRASGERILACARTRLPQNIPADTALLEGRTADAVNRAARDWGAQMIFVGTLGRTGLWRFLFGNVSESIARKAPCPVVTVRATDHAQSPVAGALGPAMRLA
jgi:nucleotide-binding universal stress UspA family protein